MKKNWTVSFLTYDGKLIESVNFYSLTEDDINKAAKKRTEINGAKLYSLEVLKSEERWIKPKIALVLGINNQYSGMCKVDSLEDIKKVKEKYHFPYAVQVVEDIPSIDDFLNSKKD